MSLKARWSCQEPPIFLEPDAREADERRLGSWSGVYPRQAVSCAKVACGLRGRIGIARDWRGTVHVHTQGKSCRVVGPAASNLGENLLQEATTQARACRNLSPSPPYQQAIVVIRHGAELIPIAPGEPRATEKTIGGLFGVR